MVSGLPDWYKASVIYPRSSSYRWTDGGKGSFTTTVYGARGTVSRDIETNLGGKTVHAYSFSANGYIDWLRNVAYTQTYYGSIAYRLSFIDVNGDLIAGLSELQTPIIVNGVDKFTVDIVLPFDRIADSNNPSYYTYTITFHVAYKVM